MTLERVLIVEDDSDIRMLAELALKDIGGLEVNLAENGLVALSVVPSWRPDLILMDVMMPVLTGPEALQRLKADPSTRDIPVVFMTAKSEHEQVDLYVGTGALDVIVKPFEPMTLADRLRALYARAISS